MSKIKRASRYRFYPTDEQRSILARTFGCTRYVYNWALRLKKATYQQTGKGLSYQQLSSALTTLKEQKETSFLGEVSCVPLQQGLRHLTRAYLNFFEGCKCLHNSISDLQEAAWRAKRRIYPQRLHLEGWDAHLGQDGCPSLDCLVA